MENYENIIRRYAIERSIKKEIIKNKMVIINNIKIILYNVKS